MKSIIDGLFVIGLLVNLTKGADLILRPAQQKWIQSKTESLALLLDYTHPIRWYSGLTKHKAKIWLAALPVTFFFVVIVYAAVHSENHGIVGFISIVILAAIICVGVGYLLHILYFEVSYPVT